VARSKMLQQAAAATVGCLLLAACASGASVKVDSIIKQGQMCAATTAEGLDELRLHVNEPQLKVFPCAAGPRAAVHLGQSRDLAVLHHVGNAEDQPQWLSALDGVAGIQVMIASADAAVVQVASNVFDLSALPRLTKYAPLHDAPIKSVDASNSARLAAIRSKAADANDPIIADTLSRITAAGMLDDLDYLTGITSDITSRNSIHPDGMKAATWIEAEFKKYGFEAALETFDSQYNPNVIATLKGSDEPDIIVVAGAHYDSRGRTASSATLPAPGANDDGSGTAALLAFARAIHERDISFKYTLVLGAWGGEEQGLIGSRAYARKCKDRNDNIIAMLQADMIAYRVGREGIQAGFPTRYRDLILTDLAIQTMNTYTPEIETCTTSVCCSDHQSFYEQGYAATQFFERCGSIADPQYHNAGDVVKRDGFDIEGEMLSMTKAVSAVALTVLEITG